MRPVPTPCLNVHGCGEGGDREGLLALAEKQGTKEPQRKRNSRILKALREEIRASFLGLLTFLWTVTWFHGRPASLPRPQRGKEIFFVF